MERSNHELTDGLEPLSPSDLDGCRRTLSGLGAATSSQTTAHVRGALAEGGYDPDEPEKIDAAVSGLMVDLGLVSPHGVGGDEYGERGLTS